MNHHGYIMPHYRREGKLLYPMTDQDFEKGLNEGQFANRKHKGLGVLLWLTGLRISEALELKKEQFRVVDDTVYIDTGIRKKKRHFSKDGKPLKLKAPEPLSIPLNAPHMEELLWTIEHTEKDQRVWPYTTRTGYNVVRRAWKYPHYFRLSRITHFLSDRRFGIPEIKSWTSLTASAIDSYVGLEKLKKMGESLANEWASTEKED